MIYLFTIIAAFAIWQLFVLALSVSRLTENRQLDTVERWTVTIMAILYNSYLIWFFKIYAG